MVFSGKAQTSNAVSVSTSATEAEVIPAFFSNLDSYNKARNQIIFTNTSAAAIVTITKGQSPAVASTGIILKPAASYFESTDGGYECYQGAFHAVSDVAGNLSIVESWVDL